MSRYSFNTTPTNKLRMIIQARFNTEREYVNVAFGFENHGICGPGYFLQVSFVTDEQNDVYIEDGFINTSKTHFIDKLEKYGLLDEVKRRYPQQFTNIVLDLPA